MPTFAADEIVTAAKLNAATARDWTAFVPVLETSNVQPVLGTGGVAEARWTQIGETVFVQGQLRYGSSGVTIGTGSYYIVFGGITSGPPNAQITMGHVATDGLPVGLGKLNDNSAGFRYTVDLELDTDIRVGLLVRASPAGRVTDAAPFAPAVNDRYRFSFWYEAA